MFRKATMVGALALMFGALLVPVAQASQVIPYLSHGIGVDKSLYGGSKQDSFPRPDDRAGIRGVGTSTSETTGFPRPDDRGGIRGVDGVAGTASAESTASLDWTRLLVGGGVVLTLMLLVAAAVASSRRHHEALQAD
jgi:hypothetical protein